MLPVEIESSNTTPGVLATESVRPIHPLQYHSNGRRRHHYRTAQRVHGDRGARYEERRWSARNNEKRTL